MKLWYSMASPFVRKVLVTIKHQQLDDNIEFKFVTGSSDPNSPHNLDNPLGRIPALQRNCGNWLFGSLLICEYLDQKGKQPSLFPKEGKPHWAALALHNLADGILENTVPMVIEKGNRPEQEWWVSRFAQIADRNSRSFAALEKAIEPFGYELNIGTLTAVCVVDWFIFRQKVIGYDLAQHYPNLVAWAAEMNARYPELSETLPRA
ncbi:glutathione S-transferase [Pasteurella langaaensis DSM 22999]|uniref:Glutathione S-transferase n=1 Tax=Alitibacter langaaensis DSM 22999 TaxID=1122935 RepID=A0A2U0SL91_9PAST|nr:glutathione S-transferase [Pasteurella langaaensis]PVX32108.1 glutathione S-transferase [Pasteurella langaaensis DSM 22999]